MLEDKEERSKRQQNLPGRLMQMPHKETLELVLVPESLVQYA